MSVPKFNEFMLPILKILAESNKKLKHTEVIEIVADSFKLSKEDRETLLSSGRRTKLYDRICWAITYLNKADLLERPERGYSKITSFGIKEFKKLKEEGINLLSSKILLERYKNFRSFCSVDKKDVSSELSHSTPEESIEKNINELRKHLKDELLAKISHLNPFFFERVVIELLLNLGYGGSSQHLAKSFEKGKDEGVDGVIYEDKLGLNLIYVQAKRWTNPIGRPEIQKFAGALQGKRVKKGIFLTTSSFSKEARDYVKNIDLKIILIDNDQLTNHMIDSKTGIEEVSSYQVFKIKEDYFEFEDAA